MLTCTTLPAVSCDLRDQFCFKRDMAGSVGVFDTYRVATSPAVNRSMNKCTKVRLR